MRHVVIAAAAAVIVACSSSSSPAPTASTNPTSPPPESAASFGDVYTKVLATRCAPCHTTPSGAGVVQGRLDMSSQAAAYDALVGKAAAGAACAGAGTRVVAGDPDASILYLKISLDDPSPCGAKMPMGGPPLAANEVDLVESWIKAGAKAD